ncbi:ABC transporter permease subunit [Actinopolyspora saharensis]|uniref:ABC-2 type transport system permease protein n=1 Tax=Actinopolyspora saharensis TaxID=995062 RepID=A0A1H1ADW2_9ACTN|nr:ABC transporter permease subunit [Actinopolyspora saharensis]SDQ37834.1 ABC-2 type transport system permease protein [Actinopolyspora saharensis]
MREESELVPEAVDEHARASGVDGSAPGYRANRTLPLNVELRRQLTRKRTRVVLGCLLALPALLIAAFALGENERSRPRATDLGDLAVFNGSNFAVFTLLLCTHLLLVLTVALFFGDSVASESSWASLRYLATIPVPRHRLLRQKALVAGLLSGLGLCLLTLSALATGTLWYGSGELITPDHGMLTGPWSALVLPAVCGYLAVHLTWVASLALLLSVSTSNPLAAVGVSVGISVVSQILDNISRLGQLRLLLPTHHATAWVDLLDSRIDWTNMANGALSAAVYASVFTTAALVRFQRGDITS